MVRLSLALGLTAMFGCAPGDVTPGGDPVTKESAAMGTENGLSSLNGLNSINGLSSVNGLNSINGLSSYNGLSSFNGLNSVNGLSSVNGLMTTNGGQITVSYIARCALPAGRSLSKKDQYGVNHSFPGQFGLAPEWETSACGTSCQEAVSACVMAHINSAGVHVPLWFDSPMTQIGYGLSTDYPNQEGTFFGNLFVNGSDGRVPMYYCEGPGFSKGVVPGRLGGVDSTAFRNPFGDGGRCDQKCSAAPGSYKGQGYASCYGYSRPITVWRQSSYNPSFDDRYNYKLVNSSTGLVVDVYNWNAAEGAGMAQWSWTGNVNQQWKIVVVGKSRWKIVSAYSGKALKGQSWSGAQVVQQTYVDADDDEWGIDDHNGHFKIVNKATKYALEVAGGNKGDIVRTAPYTGAANQDWDIIGFPP